MDHRKFSDEEIELIARRVTEQLQNDFAVNVGSGVIALAWKGAIILLIALACYGAGKHLF